MRVGLTALAGLLLAAGMSVASTQAASASLGTCEPGAHNSYEFYGWCTGSKTDSYRAVALCSNGNLTLGVARYDGDPLGSYASCQATEGSTATLSSANDWGYLNCSNDNGAGSYTGYHNISGDISQSIANYGATLTSGGTITTGGNALCDLDVNGQISVTP